MSGKSSPVKIGAQLAQIFLASPVFLVTRVIRFVFIKTCRRYI